MKTDTCGWKMMYTIVLSALLFLLLSASAQAVEVSPSGKRDNTDRRNINEAFESNDTVTLQKGKTYYLGSYIKLHSNKTLIATGATILVKKSAARNDKSELKKDYSSMSNVTIRGGKWLPVKKKGYEKTTFSLAHCRNIILENMDIRCTNTEGHAIEMVGCANVKIRNCTIIAQGKSKARSVEEMVQIDLASPKTAPFLASKYQNGLPCKNISVTGCRISGNRALCANKTEKKKYRKICHRNITVKNNVLIGRTSEALALFNALNVKVSGNKIITNSKRLDETYSTGCHVGLFGPNSAAEKSNTVIKNNLIKGGRYGFKICSYSKGHYGSLVIKNNRIYCKEGVNNALVIGENSKGESSVKKVTKSGNKLREW